MQLKLRQEIEVWYIIPAIRREIAKAMKKKVKQKDIANMLGVTDAAVSQYLSSKRASEVRFSKKINNEISKSVERIADGTNAIKEIQRLCKLCHEDGVCCFIHKHHGAPRDCKICYPD
ncbi:MAG: transcriptional regulator [Candidatus Aenigmarchaeota archaeon]|nr:transcriptional regulator [Candidatus Aenigmarchaeota archaeon]